MFVWVCFGCWAGGCVARFRHLSGTLLPKDSSSPQSPGCFRSHKSTRGRPIPLLFDGGWRQLELLSAVPEFGFCDEPRRMGVTQGPHLIWWIPSLSLSEMLVMRSFQRRVFEVLTQSRKPFRRDLALINKLDKKEEQKQTKKFWEDLLWVSCF